VLQPGGPKFPSDNSRIFVRHAIHLSQAVLKYCAYCECNIIQSRVI